MFAINISKSAFDLILHNTALICERFCGPTEDILWLELNKRITELSCEFEFPQLVGKKWSGKVPSLAKEILAYASQTKCRKKAPPIHSKIKSFAPARWTKLDRLTKILKKADPLSFDAYSTLWLGFHLRTTDSIPNVRQDVTWINAQNTSCEDTVRKHNIQSARNLRLALVEQTCPFATDGLQVCSWSAWLFSEQLHASCQAWRVFFDWYIVTRFHGRRSRTFSQQRIDRREVSGRWTPPFHSVTEAGQYAHGENTGFASVASTWSNKHGHPSTAIPLKGTSRDQAANCFGMTGLNRLDIY